MPDFQFSLGLDPGFAMPIQLDIPPTSMDNFQYIPPPPAPYPPQNMSTNTSVLNEQDQKVFSQFLDQFYVDPNMQIDPQPFSLYTNSHTFDEEQLRQSSILHSLDEQKKAYKDNHIHLINSNHNSNNISHIGTTTTTTTAMSTTSSTGTNNAINNNNNNNNHSKPNAIYLQQSNAVTAPYIIRENVKEKQQEQKQQSGSTNTISNTNGNHGNGKSGGAIRRGKSSKELLTEEEKRNNHIASEQKRRSMIRSGFKDLTEIVPTLKNINNSKSTVLFKAVDYIKYLEKRNRNLREKIKNLEIRVEVEGRMGVLGRPPQTQNHHVISSSSSTQAALLQHKTQQRQLLELQEKLQHHQKLISQQQKSFNDTNSSSSFWHSEKTKNEYEDVVSA